MYQSYTRNYNQALGLVLQYVKENPNEVDINDIMEILNRKDIAANDVAGILKEYGIDFENEAERIKFQEKIERKIKSGAKLSQKEMNYLRRYSPYLYQHMIRVQQKRESLKEQLKHCRTKEEANQAISTAFSDAFPSLLLNPPGILPTA